MATNTTTKQLEEWLQATDLTLTEQKDFIKRYKKAGHWTPILAEEFAEHLYSRITQNTEDLRAFNKTMEIKTAEYNRMADRLDSEYKALLKRTTRDASEGIKQAKNEYNTYSEMRGEAKVFQSSQDVDSILNGDI